MTRDEIEKIAYAFYQKAIKDSLIGYHFWKFEDQEKLDHHIPRITSFWEMHLLRTISIPINPPFHLMATHLPLKVRPGEIGRWAVLFKATIDEHYVDQNAAILNEWKMKIDQFHEMFLNHPALKNQWAAGV